MSFETSDVHIASLIAFDAVSKSSCFGFSKNFCDFPFIHKRSFCIVRKRQRPLYTDASVRGLRCFCMIPKSLISTLTVRHCLLCPHRQCPPPRLRLKPQGCQHALRTSFFCGIGSYIFRCAAAQPAEFPFRLKTLLPRHPAKVRRLYRPRL